MDVAVGVEHVLRDDLAKVPGAHGALCTGLLVLLIVFNGHFLFWCGGGWVVLSDLYWAPQVDLSGDEER